MTNFKTNGDFSENINLLAGTPEPQNIPEVFSVHQVYSDFNNGQSRLCEKLVVPIFESMVSENAQIQNHSVCSPEVTHHAKLDVGTSLKAQSNNQVQASL